MFRSENVETGFDETHELAEFSGFSPFDLVVFRPERLIIHELLIRVTSGLSVPDGPDYEELGINLRAMVARIYQHYVAPELASLQALHESVRQEATAIVSAELAALRSGTADRGGGTARTQRSLFKRLTQRWSAIDINTAQSFEDRLAALTARSKLESPSLESACRSALLTVAHTVIGHRGSLVGDSEILTRMAVGLVLNGWSGMRLGEAIVPLFNKAAQEEGYRSLPAQAKPVIMNVKGASASGKSTIRPKQRELAGRLGVPWEDFALISPDYWRKYLLEYETLGPVYKYGAMLTGHELEIIDRKLDRHMAEKAEAGTMPHLLVDRFRFDSFNIGDDQASQLLTRFGDTVFMFFMITPPEATVERAYKRGLTTGRYKAVDDLLDHNIEAYTGMPALFLSWALSKKRVHYEFLDNSVALDDPPKTVAHGWNGSMTILDISKMLDIDRFRKVNVDATGPDQIYDGENLAAGHNTAFLKQCAELIGTIRFADQANGHVYGVMEQGRWVFQDGDYVKQHVRAPDALAGLSALGWTQPDGQTGDLSKVENELLDGSQTLGDWGGKSTILS